MMATRDVPYTVDGALYWAVYRDATKHWIVDLIAARSVSEAVYRAMTQVLAGVVYQAVNMEPPFPGLEFYLAAAVR